MILPPSTPFFQEGVCGHYCNLFFIRNKGELAREGSRDKGVDAGMEAGDKIMEAGHKTQNWRQNCWEKERRKGP